MLTCRRTRATAPAPQINMASRKQLKAAARDERLAGGMFAEPQAAAYAAGRQKPVLELRRYREQGTEEGGYVTSNFLDGMAAQLPHLDQAPWRSAGASTAVAAHVAADQNRAAAAKVDQTPRLVVSGPRGEVGLRGVVSSQRSRRAINRVR